MSMYPHCQTSIAGIAHALAVFTILGCANSTPPAIVTTRPVQSAQPPTTAALYDRAHQRFTTAAFFKPRGPLADRIPVEMAPLIVQELARPGAANPPSDRFGTVRRDPDGSLRIDTDAPAVYADTGTVVLDDHTYEQILFIWLYPPNGPTAALTAQGLRITINADGYPILWEILADTTRKTLIFVAESLEASAAQRFGVPLPTRRYAIEKAASDAPDVVVPRLVSDGPMPMGPFVYLNARTRNVATVICRCSPSQADAFAESRYYDLLPLAALHDLGVDLANGPSSPVFAIDGRGDPRPLERSLRLPELE